MNWDIPCRAKREKPTNNTALNGAAGGNQLLSTIFSPNLRENASHFIPEEIRIAQIGKRKIIDKRTLIHAFTLREKRE